MEPQLVFIWLEEAGERRMSVQLKPAFDTGREKKNGLLYDRMNVARKPVLRQGKADRLILSKLVAERVTPYLPELIVIFAVVEKPGALVHMGGTNIAAEYVPQSVQRGIKNKINGSQGLKRDLFARSTYQSRKKRLF